jgi:hypothetical protein
VPVKLARRRAKLKFGQFEVDSEGGLAFSFDVVRDLKKEPNQATFNVFNLSESRRREFEQGTDKIASLLVGYDGQQLLEVFRGDVQVGVNTQTDRGDFVCTIKAADGERGFRGGRTSRSFRRGTGFLDVARGLAEDLIAGRGNLEETLQGQLAGGVTSQAEHGTVVTGSAADELDRLMRSHGLEWSIQGGALQVLRRGEGLNPPVILSPDSGLIGSPEIEAPESPRQPALIKCRSLLSAELFPGRLVEVRSKFVRATGRIERAKYQGDTFSEQWYVDLEVKRRA